VKPSCGGSESFIFLQSYSGNLSTIKLAQMAIFSILNRKSKKKSEDGEEREMSFVEHLEELRMHIIRAVIAIASFAILVYFITDFVFRKIIFYPLSTDFPTYKLMCWISDLLKMPIVCITPVKSQVQTFDMGEAFTLHVKVCIVGGIIMAFPYILWELWKFIKPGLHKKEIRAARGAVAYTSILFMLGVAFGYFILAPFSINFLVGYQLPMVNEEASMIKAGSFINYMIMFTIPSGLVFELPIIIFFLSRLGIITDKDMRTYRRHSIIGILVIAAIVTPPDVLSQMIVAFPIFILYELSIGIAARQTKRREKEVGINKEYEDL
jgi:sec-independent protein translocase protein TatC